MHGWSFQSPHNGWRKIAPTFGAKLFPVLHGSVRNHAPKYAILHPVGYKD